MMMIMIKITTATTVILHILYTAYLYIILSSRMAAKHKIQLMNNESEVLVGSHCQAAVKHELSDGTCKYL